MIQVDCPGRLPHLIDALREVGVAQIFLPVFQVPLGVFEEHTRQIVQVLGQGGFRCAQVVLVA